MVARAIERGLVCPASGSVERRADRTAGSLTFGCCCGARPAHPTVRRVLVAHGLILRPWDVRDIPSLTFHANNRSVSRNLKDRFPYPYRVTDAEAWIAHCVCQTERPRSLAIEVDGQAVGGVGVDLLEDIHRLTAEIGYWLAEPLWGRGLATTAVNTMTSYAFGTFGLERLQAMVFQGNVASARVLEKCGYALEGRLQRNVVKDGHVLDSLLYARLPKK
jgi:ribosomal-protein-alanine N-acetyltransferase